MTDVAVVPAPTLTAGVALSNEEVGEYWNTYVVSSPFGSTVPDNAAPDVVTPAAEPVVTDGRLLAGVREPVLRTDFAVDAPLAPGFVVVDAAEVPEPAPVEELELVVLPEEADVPDPPVPEPVPALLDPLAVAAPVVALEVLAVGHPMDRSAAS